MARLRYNGLSNSLGAALTDSGTTITFASKLTYAGGDVPTIGAGDYISLSILDSDGNCAEVVHLTAYTSAATTGTIARGKEDTSGVAHDSAAVVVNGATRDDVRFSGCLVTSTGASGVANGSAAAVAWDTEVYDTDTYHDNSTNNSRLTVPAAGYYEIGATIYLLDLDEGEWVMAWFREDAVTDTDWGRIRHYGGSTNTIPAFQVVSPPVYLAAGSYVEVMLETSKSGGVTVRASSNGGTNFWIRRID